ncbi:hypothetical protein [Thermogutta sp.]|uniref:hypothetical protein n=1 Tax=Thermogutta sp. TaxID=1962930 RepID=UPI00322049DE
MVPQEVPQHFERQPQVVVVGVRFAAVHQAAEAADAVVVPVEVGTAEQSTLFGDEQKEEAVHQMEQVAVERFGSRVPIRICLQEAGAQDFEAFLHPLPQLFACPVALFERLLVVAFEPALVRIGYAPWQAGTVEQAVEQDKIFEAGVALGVEDGFQVEFHVNLASDLGAIAQQTDRAPVGDDAPDVIGTVEELLEEPVRGHAWAGVGVHASQLPAGADDMHRWSILRFSCSVGDRVVHATDLVRPGVVAQLVAQKPEEGNNPALAGEAGGGVVLRESFQAATEDLPEVPGIPVSRGNLIEQVATSRKTEIC